MWGEFAKIKSGEQDHLLVNAFGPLMAATLWIIGDKHSLNLIKSQI